MAEPWNTLPDSTPILIFHRRYCVYDEGLRRTAEYLVEEYHFDDARIFSIKILRAFVDLD